MEHSIDVRAIRIKLKFTQAQLADAVGVDQSTVSNWENGMPPRGPAKKLLETLVAEADANPAADASKEAEKAA